MITLFKLYVKRICPHIIKILDKAEVLLKEETLPHLIPIGKWGGFWLKIPTGHISLGYEGLDNYLFDWKHSDESPTEGQRHEIFKPMFITFTSVKGQTIGVNFPCDGQFEFETYYDIKGIFIRGYNGMMGRWPVNMQDKHKSLYPKLIYHINPYVPFIHHDIKKWGIAILVPVTCDCRI